MEQTLEELDKIRQHIEDSFHTVSMDSKALLGELQKPTMAYDDQFLKSPEYSEASSHVMDIYLEVHEHHRQLGILLEKQRTHVRDHLHLCMFDQDSSQVCIKIVPREERVGSSCIGWILWPNVTNGERDGKAGERVGNERSIFVSERQTMRAEKTIENNFKYSFWYIWT